MKKRKLRVEKPRLRRKGRGAGKEVRVPVYDALQHDPATGERMLQILMNGVSTRLYRKAIPEMASFRIADMIGALITVYGDGKQVRAFLFVEDLLDAYDAAAGNHAVGRTYWRAGDQRVFISDVRRATEELGWAPKIDKTSGLERLYHWICNNETLFLDAPSILAR